MASATNRIIPFRDRKGQYRFRIKGRNGKVIAQSEGYPGRRNRDHAMELCAQGGTVCDEDGVKVRK